MDRSALLLIGILALVGVIATRPGSDPLSADQGSAGVAPDRTPWYGVPRVNPVAAAAPSWYAVPRLPAPVSAGNRAPWYGIPRGGGGDCGCGCGGRNC